MRVGFTYNIKKEVEHSSVEPISEGQDKKALNENIALGSYVDENLVNNYSNRLSDVYAEWDDEETISAVENAIKKAGHEVIRIEADENAFDKLRSE